MTQAHEAQDWSEVILHLSDLHFGMDETDELKLAERQSVLDGVLRVLGRLDADWRPTIICITGDIGSKGVASDYVLAKQWIDRLVAVTAVANSSLVLCPGNHDSQRVTARLNVRPSGPAAADQADQWLRVPLQPPACAPFADYEKFCESSGLAKFSMGSHSSYLSGSRMVRSIKFVALNSAWFSQNGDRAQLWLGQPLLKLLDGQKEIQCVLDTDADCVTIGIVHHPFEWWHEQEIGQFGARPSTRDYLANRCHIILSGHTHTGVRHPDQIARTALHFNGGAAYAGAHHFNNFTLLRIAGRRVSYRMFEWDPRSSTEPWTQRGGVESLMLCSASSPPPAATPAHPGIAQLISDASSHAAAIVESKSRQIRREGPLPRLTPLKVVRAEDLGLLVGEERDRRVVDGRIVRFITLQEAFTTSRCLLLLGDLGSGKSTILGQFAVEVMARRTGELVLVVPIKDLVIGRPLTVRGLLEAIGVYVAEQVSPRTGSPNLIDILEARDPVRVTVCLDGLDEIPQKEAREALDLAALIIQHWSSLRIVATGRQIELAGMNYSRWQQLRIPPLSLEDHRRLFAADADATISDVTQRPLLVEKALAALRKHRRLAEVSTTPLATRVVFGKLAVVEDGEHPPSLGDLLHDLLLERLGVWSDRDGKRVTWPALDKYAATPMARASLLGRLAWASLVEGDQPAEAARGVFRSAARESGDPTSDTFAENALRYFIDSGLVVSGHRIEFPLRPLMEISAAAYLADVLPSMPKPELDVRRFWRVLGFVGTMIRRRALSSGVARAVEDLVLSLLKLSDGVPCACFVLSELRDPSMASRAVLALDALGRRPLSGLPDEPSASAGLIAETLRLAGDKGFRWFYREYLDPRYPPQRWGALLIGNIFDELMLPMVGTLDAGQRQALAEMVLPQQSAPRSIPDYLPRLAMLVPEAFEADSQVKLVAHLIGDWHWGQLAEAWLTEAAQAGQSGIVSAVLGDLPEDYTEAPLIWLQINPGTEPPAHIVRRLLIGAIQSPHPDGHKTALKFVEMLMGAQRFQAVMRWHLTDTAAKVRTGAALALYESGERRLELLGPPLMDGLHDGGYVALAEDVLRALLLEDPVVGLHWLVSAHGRNRWNEISYRSGCWRIFLDLMEQLRAPRPDLLAAMTAHVGWTILPRYPAIRWRLQVLLRGRDAHVYVTALRRTLGSDDPKARMGAAMILSATFPHSEGDAVVVCLRARDHHRFGHWWEWEKLLASVGLGPSVLAAIRHDLDRVPRSCRVLALALLARGGSSLSDAERQELMTSLVEPENHHLDAALGAVGLSSSLAREALVHAISAGNLGVESQRLAWALLDRHRTSLDVEIEARCLVYGVRRRELAQMLPNLIKHLTSHPQMRSAVLQTGALAEETLHHRNPVTEICRAIETPQHWREVVWALLCDDSEIVGSLEAEEAGDSLIEVGRSDPVAAQHIGDAARQFLNDPRIRNGRQMYALEWLALLADEFVGNDLARLEEALCAGTPIRGDATGALIRRLGRSPGRYNSSWAQALSESKREPVRLSADEAQLFDVLMECCRPSEVAHPDTCRIIEALVSRSPLEGAQLIALSSTGFLGLLAAGALRLCYGERASPRDLVATLSYMKWHLLRSDTCARRLWTLNSIARVLSQASAEDKAAYLAELDLALETSENKTPLALERLEQLGALLPPQLERVIEEYARRASVSDFFFGRRLAQWLAGTVGDEERLAAIKALQQVVSELDELPWDSKEGDRETSVLMGIPLMLWRLTGAVSQASASVFLRGMKFLLEDCPVDAMNQPKRQRLKQDSTRIEALQPLLKTVHPPLLAEVFSLGLNSHDGSVRGWCSILLSLVPDRQGASDRIREEISDGA